MTTISVQLLHPLAVAPQYAHDGDAGADLVSVVNVHLAPGERTLVDTGIAIAIPEGWVGLVHPRSGLAAKQGLGIVNAPGTIDAGYRGEVKVCLINLDATHDIDLPAGSRIAQLVIQRVERAEFPVVNELPSAERGLDGFGSTGVTS